MTPDAGDPNTNKRPWEKAVGLWRQEWREIDGVRKLVSMTFEENASRNAWRQAKKMKDEDADLRQRAHDHEAQLHAAIDILTRGRGRS